MPFVQHGRQGHKSDGSHFDFDPIALLMPEASVCENCQDEILGDVAEFANREMPEVDLFRRQSRKKVRQRRNDELRRLVGRESVCGENKSYYQPQNNGEVVFKKTSFQYSAMRTTTLFSKVTNLARNPR